MTIVADPLHLYGSKWALEGLGPSFGHKLKYLVRFRHTHPTKHTMGVHEVGHPTLPYRILHVLWLSLVALSSWMVSHLSYIFLVLQLTHIYVNSQRLPLNLVEVTSWWHCIQFKILPGLILIFSPKSERESLHQNEGIKRPIFDHG